MDDSIPIFNGVTSTSGSVTTCGQFLSSIESHAAKVNLAEIEIKELCLSKLSDTALELFKSNIDKTWEELKIIMAKQFSMKLSIREKVEVRKKLKQQNTECISDFYKRCEIAQYLVSDDIQDVAFEREILLNFLIGLLPSIRDLVLASKCSNTSDFINEAKKHIQFIKEEPIDENIKIESEDFDVKNPADYLSQTDEFYEDEFNERDDYFDDNEYELEDEDNDKNEEMSTNEFNSDSFTTKSNTKIHPERIQKDIKHKNIFIKNKQRCKGSGRCRICTEEFESKEIRLHHEENVHGHLKQTCEKCNEICLTIKHLASHIASKHCEKNQEGQHVCMYCNAAKSIRPQLLGYHILRKHFNKPRFPCNQCEKGFDQNSLLIQHIAAAHSEERAFSCDTCGKTFKTNAHLRTHVTNVHTEERAFQCDKCAKAFKTLLSLNIHVANLHEEQIEAKCEECDRTFKNERYLKNHQKVMHSGNRTRVMCDDCGKSFATKENFRIHCVKAHSSAEEMAKHMHECPHPGCDYAIVTKSHLKSHYKRVHLKEKSFQCTLCPKSFFNKKIFEEHTNGVHLNLKPFQCDKCQFASAYSSKLWEHQRVAHGNQRYDCPHCNHSARYKGNLDKHINNVHKNIQTIQTERDML